MKPEKIRLFIKPYCGWCDDAEAWLEQRGLPYEKLDVIANAAARKEMTALSGQSAAPVIEVDGEVLADFGVDELEPWWREHGWEEKSA
jgi:glutaredoxin